MGNCIKIQLKGRDGKKIIIKERFTLMIKSLSKQKSSSRKDVLSNIEMARSNSYPDDRFKSISISKSVTPVFEIGDIDDSDIELSYDEDTNDEHIRYSIF